MKKLEKKIIDGIFLLNKPIGMSSNKALSKVKFLFNAKKAGHTGSLDPLATGMLPVCFGQATKYSQFLLDANKCYQVTGKLGVQTDTGDREGTITQTVTGFSISESALKAVLTRFQGKISQVPPMYSALKKDGKPLYDYARRGITIERKAREVTIFSLELLAFNGVEFELRVVCSKGTYIRSLVEDIGHALNVGAHVSVLHRHYSEPFDSQSMMSLESLIESYEQGIHMPNFLLPIDSAITPLEKLVLEPSAILRLQNGLSHRLKSQSLAALAMGEERQVRIYDVDGSFCGVAILTNGELKPFRMLPKR